MKLYFIILILFITGCTGHPDHIIELNGSWAFQADPEDQGINEEWFRRTLEGNIELPGSMAINGYGDDISVHTQWTGQIVDSAWYKSDLYKKYRQPGNIKVPFWLQPEKHYVGVAWYQKTFQVPVSWQDKHLELLLERCHWEVRVWVDDEEKGMQNSLGTPDLFNLGENLAPGHHRLTIRIDNRIRDIDPGINAHSVTDHTQTNWNGIVGIIRVIRRPAIYMEEVRIFPDIAKRSVKINVRVVNRTPNPTVGFFNISAKSFNTVEEHKAEKKRSEVEIEEGVNTFKLEYALGRDALLWDEFHPNLYHLNVQLTTGAGIDEMVEDFGMRQFEARGSRFVINGQPVFLRGTLECAVSPETGYPATDTEHWENIFKTASAYGLNHIRFHSWCPPEAAFKVADRMGFYLQVECSAWAHIGDGKPIDRWIMEESERIVKYYGNHPSFCMLAYGNEPGGKNYRAFLTRFVRYWKEKDPRRVYTGAAGWPALSVNDYDNLPGARIQGWGQGLKSRINRLPPSTDFDYSAIIKKTGKPYVSHEIGQWCAYPDFKEIPTYNGELREKNFEIFQETLKDHRMAHLADSFLLASGKLQVLCYKEDIEAALRTRGMAGFQLLGLSDFPGQGTALVGVVNALWNEKGYVKGGEYRHFCDKVVPLVRFPKRIYTAGEQLVVPVEVAYFDEQESVEAQPAWYIREGENTLYQGKLKKVKLSRGNGQALGVISVKLETGLTAVKQTLFVDVAGHTNQWDFWVYPSKVNIKKAKEKVLVVSRLNGRVVDYLKGGGKVLLTLGKGKVAEDKGGDVGIGFSSIFWNTAWTRGQKPHTLGILCNPAHPALADFPTEYHSNWQWWDAMSHSDAILLDSLAPGIQPIVRVIDDWFTNRSLGLIVEGKVGDGRILITGIDLRHQLSRRPEAGQLLYSLLRYMNGENFNPETTLDEERIRALIR